MKYNYIILSVMIVLVIALLKPSISFKPFAITFSPSNDSYLWIAIVLLFTTLYFFQKGSYLTGYESGYKNGIREFREYVETELKKEAK